MRRTAFLSFSMCLLASSLLTGLEQQAEPKPQIRILQTSSGVRFGLRGDKGKSPAPVLFVFATEIEDTLVRDAFNKVGRILCGQGALCVALDLPCHGRDVRPGEAKGLDGWSMRLEKGDELVSPFLEKASGVLDFLIQEGYADARKIAACGTSRGGFIALHFAAAEPRVRCVAAFAPVTDLLVLREFKGLTKHAHTNSLALANHAEKLAERAVWICIGNNDQRVGTDQAIALTRKIVEAAHAHKKPAPVELHVTTAPGHRTHATAHDEAAAWILARLKSG